MEIERKWMVDGWPEESVPDASLVLQYTEMQEQGYLHATVPIVRIRREERAGASEGCTLPEVKYVLCFKSAGRLARQEIELEIPAEKYQELKEMIGSPLIGKVRRAYALPDGHTLEVNLVDQGLPSQFWYAEVEFDSIGSARSWDPAVAGLGTYLDDDVTEQPGQSMSAYWLATRGGMQQ